MEKISPSILRKPLSNSTSTPILASFHPHHNSASSSGSSGSGGGNEREERIGSQGLLKKSAYRGGVKPVISMENINGATGLSGAGRYFSGANSDKEFHGDLDEEFLDELNYGHDGHDHNNEYEVPGQNFFDVISNSDSDSSSDEGENAAGEISTFSNKDLLDFEEEVKKRLFYKTYSKVYKKVDFVLEHVNILLSVVSIGLFIALSYMSTIPHSINTILLVISIFLFVDFFRTFIFAKNKISFFKKKNTILDLITLLPIFVTLLPNEFVPVTPLGFLRVLRILKAPRLFKLHGVTTIILKVASLVLSILILIVLFASLMTEIEKIKFHNALYFAVVTLSTVGYGDISPQTVLGRMVVILMIGIALLYLPLQINQLLTTLSLNKPWHGKYSPSAKKKFIMIAGNLYKGSLKTFLDEFYVNSRIKEIPTIVLSNNDPPTYWNEIKTSYTRHLVYLKGVVSIQNDIERSSMNRAKSIFIFSKKLQQDSISDDNENVLRVLSIRSFNSNIPIFAQVMEPRLKFKMLAAGASQVICIQELKMNLLAQSCISPGFLTLMMNLLSADLIKHSEFDEYAYGNNYEIYSQPFSPSFFGLTFGEVVQIVYNAYGMILFGIEIIINGIKVVKINPKNSLPIQNGFNGILMAKNKSMSKKIKFATSEFIQMYTETLKISKQINSELGLLGQQCKLVWEYDQVTSSYQSKLKFFKDSDKDPKKGLKKLLLEKKKAIYQSNYRNTVNYTDNTNTPTIYDKANKDDSNNTNNFFDMVHNRVLLTNNDNPNNNNNDPDNNNNNNEIDNPNNVLSATTEIPIPPPPPTPLDNSSYQGYGKTLKLYRKTAKEYKDSLVHSVEYMDNINNHVILAGNDLRCLDNFIGPLRAPYIKHIDPIVLLTPKFNQSEWKYIEKYSDIYIVEGIVIDLNDLKRAGILKCLKVVVLSQSYEDSDPILADKESLLASIAIKSALKYNKNIFPIYEINNPSNMKFLPANRNWNQNSPQRYSPSFAAGNVFSMSLFDGLLCQCFFNQNLLSLIKLLVGDQSSKKTLIKVFQVPLPSHFIHHKFSYLFDTLLQSNIIVIGLLRTKRDHPDLSPLSNSKLSGIEMNPITSNLDSTYVLTNPVSHTILNETDKLFILIRVNNLNKK